MTDSIPRASVNPVTRVHIGFRIQGTDADSRCHRDSRRTRAEKTISSQGEKRNVRAPPRLTRANQQRMTFIDSARGFHVSWFFSLLALTGQRRRAEKRDARKTREKGRRAVSPVARNFSDQLLSYEEHMWDQYFYAINVLLNELNIEKKRRNRYHGDEARRDIYLCSVSFNPSFIIVNITVAWAIDSGKRGERENGGGGKREKPADP